MTIVFPFNFSLKPIPEKIKMKGSIQKKGKTYYAVAPIAGKRKWFRGGTKKDAEKIQFVRPAKQPIKIR